MVADILPWNQKCSSNDLVLNLVSFSQALQPADKSAEGVALWFFEMLTQGICTSAQFYYHAY
jgi:hypothetical protein